MAHDAAPEAERDPTPMPALARKPLSECIPVVKFAFYAADHIFVWTRADGGGLDLPGGKAGPGEALAAAAFRELREELDAPSWRCVRPLVRSAVAARPGGDAAGLLTSGDSWHFVYVWSVHIPAYVHLRTREPDKHLDPEWAELRSVCNRMRAAKKFRYAQLLEDAAPHSTGPSPGVPPQRPA